MNLIWVLFKMCMLWQLPAAPLRISRTVSTGFTWNPLAPFAMPVRLQLARIHPPPTRRRH
ncbi:MAG: hypothetical protein EBW49_11775 [Betaproteobacteria bacterium]|nr:hypothetical protein [Betaproteobacteria bacterium]